MKWEYLREEEFEVLRRSYVNVTSRFPECK